MSGWQQMVNTDVLTLGMAADEARRAHAPDGVVTYVRVHAVSPADLAASASIPEAASEIRLYATPATLDEALDQVRALREAAGSRRVSAFSMADIEQRGWGGMAQVLAQLAGAGLDDVAALPVDQVADLSASIRALRDAGLQPERISVQHPLGDRKTEIITTVQQALAASGPVRRFAPLPRVAPSDKPTTGYDDLRMVALSRLALGALSIEVDWMLYGPKLAQVALTFGADHLDGVPATDDPDLGRRRATAEDVERNIRAAGFQPRLLAALGH